MSNLRRETAIDVFNDKGIEFGEFPLKSHKRWPGAPLSPYFISLRLEGSSAEHKSPLAPETVDKIGKLMVETFGDVIRSAQYIAGIPAAGDPIVDAIMKHLPEEVTVKRLYLEKVGTGESRTIALDGSKAYEAGAKVLLVDDLITRADSKIEAARSLRFVGMIVEECLVLVDRQQGGPEEASAAGIKISSVFTVDELLQIYLEEGLITADQVEEVKSYQERFDEYTRTHEPVAGNIDQQPAS